LFGPGGVLDDLSAGLGGLSDAEEDLDHDGRLDANEDANGNGQLDPGEDLDGDGHLDVDEDLNGNGILDVDDVIQIPVFFFADAVGNQAVAMLPDMVNLQVVDALRGDGRVPHFLNIWDFYHRMEGESHCGTNVRRTSPEAFRRWWEHW
jgi:hypothetical protein